MGTIWHTDFHPVKILECFFLQEWLCSGTTFPELLCNLHPWRYSIAIWIKESLSLLCSTSQPSSEIWTIFKKRVYVLPLDYGDLLTRSSITKSLVSVNTWRHLNSPTASHSNQTSLSFLPRATWLCASLLPLSQLGPCTAQHNSKNPEELSE